MTMQRSCLTYGTIAVLTAILTSAIASSQTVARTHPLQLMTQQPVAMMSASMMADSMSATVTRSGAFMAAEHPTQGMARIVTDGGKTYLELDRQFKTDSGPDLHVILYRTAQPPISGIQAADYVSLGRLQKITGSQRYLIPPSVNPGGFQSAAIWCRKFNATFGYAPLSQ